MSVTVEVVEPDVVRLRCRSWRGALFGYDVSAYLVRGVLVDTGFPRARREFMRAVRSLAPRGVVVTHWHEDHAGNAPALAAAGMPLLMDARCEATLRRRPGIALYRSTIWGRPPRLVDPLRSFDVAPLQLLPLPGHTADHQALWDPERRILAAGDLFLGVKVRVAHHEESHPALLDSLRRAAALEPRLLLDAHRGPLLNGPALLRAKIAWIEDTVGEIHRLAASGIGAREICHRVLGSEELVGRVSFGEYSRRSFVEAALREIP